MRMSDTVDTEIMKVSEAADMVSSPKDNIASKSEVTDQSQSGKDEHGSNNKRDVQVKNSPVAELEGGWVVVVLPLGGRGGNDSGLYKRSDLARRQDVVFCVRPKPVRF